MDKEAGSTRQRILAIADALIEREGPGVPLTRIAKSAGVSRQTLYLLFGDRVGLFRALWNFRIGSDDTTDPPAFEKMEPLEAFETLYRVWIRRAIKHERSMRPLWTVDGDADLMKALKEADDGAIAVYRRVFRRLYEAGYLRNIWAPDEAADACWQHVLYLVFVGHIKRMRPWSPEEIEERGMKVLRAAFLTDEAAKKAAAVKVP